MTTDRAVTAPTVGASFSAAVFMGSGLAAEPRPGMTVWSELRPSGALSRARNGSSVSCHFSQITSISALLAIDFNVMCGTRS